MSGISKKPKIWLVVFLVALSFMAGVFETKRGKQNCMSMCEAQNLTVQRFKAFNPKQGVYAHECVCGNVPVSFN